MTDTITYTLKVNSENYTIDESDFERKISYLLKHKIRGDFSFKINIISQDSLSSEMLNYITNHYIDELLKEDRCFSACPKGKDYADNIKSFICTALRLMKQNTSELMSSYDYTCFDIINRQYYFKVFLKNDETVKENYDNMMNLGPDYLMGNSLAYYPEIMPAFYMFLYENDGFDNPEINNLAKYMIGLH